MCVEHVGLGNTSQIKLSLAHQITRCFISSLARFSSRLVSFVSLSFQHDLVFSYLFTSSILQFTEEKFGQAEKTELDAHLENLLVRAETTKHWTEKIMKQTEVLLQPNPSTTIYSCPFVAAHK